MFPNPARGDLVEIQTYAERLTLYDQFGRVCVREGLVQKTAEGFRIDTQFLALGMYQVVLSKGNSQTSKKLIVSGR